MTETDHGELRPALRVIMMPRDTNHYGTIFGGVLLSYIDQAAFVQSRRHGRHRWVTVSIDRVDFTAPVFVGDVVLLLARTMRTGTTSVQVEIVVEAERHDGGERVLVTTAHMTMVSVSPEGRPIPFAGPPTADEPWGRKARS